MRSLDLTVAGKVFLAASLVLLGRPESRLWGQTTGAIVGEVREFGTNRPIANAQVSVEGTNRGGLSNQRGSFTIPDVPAGEVAVVVTFLGYASERQVVRVPAGGTATVHFELRQTAIQLTELVVTGAGVATERRKLGNTIATLDASSFATQPVANLSEILTAREPGVVGLPSGGLTGEGARIRIRGSASLSQSNEPVVYVDGVRVDNSGDFGPGIGAGGGGRPSRLDDINPDAIERIEILKGPAAATLYGTQASNGVIQIFTKAGKSGVPRYDLVIEQGFSRYPTDRIRPLAGFVLAADPSPRPHGTDIGTKGVKERWGLDVKPYEVFEVNPWGDIFGTGRSQTYSLSATGGTQAATYFVSGRFFKEDGPMDGSALRAPGFQVANDVVERRQFNANLETFPRPDLRIRITSNYTEAFQSTVDNNNNIYGVFSSLLFSRPELARPTNRYGQPSFATTRENFHRQTSQEVQRYGGALTLGYSPRPDLSVDATVGVDFVNQHAVRFFPFGWNVDGFTASNVRGLRTVSDRNHREVTLDLKGSWSVTLGRDFSSSLVVGGQGFLTRTEAAGGTGNEFPGPGLEVAGAGALQSVFESFLEEVNVGLLAQNQIGFRDYLFLTLGARYDKHSAFGQTAGGAVYPKISASWIPSDMPGWKGTKISTLRFRLALGKSGLQPGAFDKFTTFSPLAAATGPGVQPANLGNPDLKPETAMEWEAGAEVGLFRDRASVNATYWRRRVDDLLVARQFAPSGGFRAQQLDNIGQMMAWGLEFGSQFFVIQTSALSLDLFANASFLREKITDLGGAPPLKVGGSYPRYRQFTMEGYHPGAFFGPKLDNSVEFPIDMGGCRPPASRQELLTYFSVPRNPSVINPLVVSCGKPDMLLQYLGKPVPDWQGSFGAGALVLGKLRINSVWEYRFGNFYIHDLDSAFRRSNPIIGRNLRKAAQAEATLLNPASTAEERLAAALVWVRELRALSPYDGLNEIHKADWLRLRELSFTYTAPDAWALRLGARTLSISLGARNLLLFTKYPGMDPEINAVGRSDGGGLDANFNDGVSAFGLPLPKRITLTVRAGF